MGVLVTGGGGFLGFAIVKALLQQGRTVRSFSRNEYPHLRALGVEQIQGDLANADHVATAVKGCTTVYHCAAKAGVWGSASSYETTNVQGTKNVIQACRKHGVTKLVFTSSPSVSFGGTDQQGVDETCGYPARYLAHYPRTKALAEMLVNNAADARLATVSLRPHLIWGPEDPHLVPRIINRGRAGKLRLVGKGDKLVDSVYVDNAAIAHVMAEAKLEPLNHISGKNYFITNDHPTTMAALINGILHAGGLPPVTKQISPGLAFGVGTLMEWVYTLLRKKTEPIMTRFVARQLATAHWFDIKAAKNDFGYRAIVSHEEGLKRLKTWLDTQPF